MIPAVGHGSSALKPPPTWRTSHGTLVKGLAFHGPRSNFHGAPRSLLRPNRPNPRRYCLTGRTGDHARLRARRPRRAFEARPFARLRGGRACRTGDLELALGAVAAMARHRRGIGVARRDPVLRPRLPPGRSS